MMHLTLARIDVDIHLKGDTYRVPGPDGGEKNAYYTRDREDALKEGKARWIAAGCPNVHFNIKRIDLKGTALQVQSEPFPNKKDVVPQTQGPVISLIPAAAEEAHSHPTRHMQLSISIEDEALNGDTDSDNEPDINVEI